MNFTGKARMIWLVAASSAWAAADCSHQAIVPGTYVIHSVYHDQQPRCVDLRTQDLKTIQFFQCNGTNGQKFTIGSPEASTGCFSIAANTNPVTFVQDTTSALSDPDFLQALQSNGTNIYWWVKDNGDNTLSFVSAHVPTRQVWCMNRRDGDGEGRAQLLKCTGTSPLEKFTVTRVSAALEDPQKKASPSAVAGSHAWRPFLGSLLPSDLADLALTGARKQ